MSTTQLQHAWYELTRARSFTSLAIVPVEEGAQTLVLAQELAALAARDPRQRVLVINATGTPAMRAAASKELPLMPGREMFDGNGIVPVAQGRFGLLDCARQNMDEASVGMVEVPRYVDDVRNKTGPFTLILVAANSPVARPASISCARAADVVLLCVTLGKTSMADGRRVIELCGEENMVGSLAWRPRA